MKTTKEFPATHSMSTTWFVADEEGNIALFDFDENGPVPIEDLETKNIVQALGPCNNRLPPETSHLFL